MADAVPRTAEQVRVAANVLKAAIDRHLDAVIRRQNDSDPAVLEAFEALGAAAENYDELLFEVYDEVTPFDVPDDGMGDLETVDDPETLSVFIRRDYHVVDADTLVASAREAAAEGTDESLGPVTGVVSAAAMLFDTYEADEIHARAEELGLSPADDTLWLTIESDPPDPGEWLSDPFRHIDTRQVVYRVDTTQEQLGGKL